MPAHKASQTPDIAARRPRLDGGQRLRLSLAALVLAWGVQAIVTQSLLLREAMVLMYGSEFAWGIVLFAWLAGITVGAVIGGRLVSGWLARRGRILESAVRLPGQVPDSAAHRQRQVGGILAGVLLALSIAAGLELWIFRGARAWLGVGPGELLPVGQTIAAALLFVSPVSALVGLAFPLACAMTRNSAPARTADSAALAGPVLSLGRVYAIESGGSLLGGAAFSFWAVEHLAPIQITLLCGAATALASAGFMAAVASAGRGHGRRGLRLRAPRWLAGLAGIAVLVAILGGDALDRRLTERRWKQLAPGYELVASAESKYQNLALGRRAGQFSLYCDGQVAADFPDPYTFAPLTHFWMCQHPAPRRVLMLGGGTEGVLSEMLRHPVEHVDTVDPDPRQKELVLPYLPAIDQAALADPRVTVHAVDARYFIKTQHERFDLVIARLPEPTSALRARFYTDEFYAELRRAMAPQAVLCLSAAAAPTELSELSREYLASIRATLQRHFPELVIGWGDPAQVLAATAPGLITTDPAEMSARYAQRAVISPMFDPAWFAGATDWLQTEKLARREADLDAAGRAAISTDLHPTIYLQRLSLWEAAAGARGGRRALASTSSWLGRWRAGGFIARLRSVRVAHVAGMLTAIGALALLAARWRRGAHDGWTAGALSISVASTGFATMSLSILWLFAFQNLYGYVYQRIGWIIALFMAGLVLGCIVAGRNRSRLWGWLICTDLLLAFLGASVPFLWRALAALQGGSGGFTIVEICISVMVIATGFLGGAAFAWAGQVQLGLSSTAGTAAGTIVAADHAGACLGAATCGLVLVPVLGVASTAFLLGGVKLISAALLCWTRR